MAFTLTTSQAIIALAGANVNTSASTSGALLALFCNEAEGVVCAYSRYDWVTNYATVLAICKPLLDEATACYAANKLINYSMGDYTSNGEAVTMLNVNLNNFNKAMARLEDKDFQYFMNSI